MGHNDFMHSMLLWTSRQIEDAFNASLVVVADVIYGDQLTDAFFSTMERLMSRPTKIVSLEDFMKPKMSLSS